MTRDTSTARSHHWFETPPRHLTRAIALEESPLPKLWRVAVTTIGCMMAAFIVWAAFARVEEVANGAGQVIPNGYVQAVQHLEGGIVRQIMVEEGQMVEKGQPLIRLDATTADADLGQMRARQKALQLQASRLRNFVTTGTDDHEKLTQNEQAILSSMEEARASQQNVLRDQIAQKEKEAYAFASTRTALNKNVALMEQETAIHENMAQTGVGSRLTALTSERELNQLRGQRDEAASQESRARDAIREAKNRLQSLDADLKQDAMKNLGQVEAELAEVTKTLTKLKDASTRTVVASPVRGIVKGLAVHTEGAVVESGKVLMEIVPLDNELIVEAMVSPNDIGHLRTDQTAKVKISAFDFSRYGSVKGHLESISASSFPTEDGQSFYKVKIRLDQPYVGHDPKRNLIMPGMTVQAGVITGEKTVLQYLLKPIHTAVDNAFNET